MSASASPSPAAAGGGFARRRFLRAAPPSVPAPSAANQPINHTHTHAFNGPLSGTNRVSRYQKGKTNLDFTEARDSEWQWHQLDHIQVCTSLQTDDHASTPPLSFLQAGCPSCRPTNSVKALKATSLSITGLFSEMLKSRDWTGLQKVQKFGLRLRMQSNVSAQSQGKNFGLEAKIFVPETKILVSFGRGINVSLENLV